uniref:Uncharacterized protein n=1 Tax=Tanacetum cinerariifolium TaxID=118510 RepID=A0A6L2JVH5_TANCI|nr:hypothetical protein [Tanacetum cinerariifolium]
MSYLSEYEEINGGYVAFGRDPNGGKITGKGKISTDTECVVLSSDFKLLDESQVFLRVPRKNNMYSVDLKNVAPSGGLTYLFAKATSDKSNLWHRRLGHINFKTMNKLVRRNLVRGSKPTWLFDIDTVTKSMNYKPVVAVNQSNGSAVTKSMNYKPVVAVNQSNGSAGKARVETVPDKDYILLPLWTHDLLFSSSSKDSLCDGFKPLGEEEMKDAEDPGNEDNEVLSTEESRVNQEKDANVNSTNNINTVSQTDNVAGITDNVVDENIVYRCVDDPNMPNLEEIVYSDEDEDVVAEANMTNLDTNIPVSPIPTTRIHKDHPVEQIIKDIHSAPQTRRMTKNVTNHGIFSLVQQMINHKDFQNCLFACFLSQVEPKKAIGTKWIYRNKKDKRGIVVRNKARLVAQSYTQEEGIDYDEVFALVARIKAIRLFLAYALFKDFVVYQMDVKSAFLYGKVEKDVYVCQPLGFEDPKFPDRVYKTASTPIETSKPLMKDENAKDVDVYLYRSMIGSLMYLASLKSDIMFVVCACVRFQVTPKVLHIYVVKRIFRYLKGQPKLGLWYPKDSPFNLKAYTDSDYAGASLDRKFTTGCCQFLRSRLISWLPLELQLLRVYLVYKKENSRIENVDFAEIVDFLNANPIRKTKRKATEISQSSGPTTLVADETVHEEKGDRVERAATTASSLDAEQDSGGSPRRQDTILRDRPAQTRFERLSKQSHEPPLLRVKTLESEEDRFRNYSSKEESHEVGKEKKVKNSTTQKEDAEIQRRYGHDIEINTASTSVTTTSFNITTVEPVTTVSTPITTAVVSVSTVEPNTPPTTTAVIEDEDLIISKTLMKMRSEKLKEKAKERGSKENSSKTPTRPTKGVIMREASETTTRPIVPPQQKLDLKDKGKGKIVEPKKPLKKKDHTEFDKEVAQRLQAQLQAELEEEERMARQKEEDANIAEWDDVQAMMDADYELAERLQAEEQGELSIKKRSKLFVELMNQRKKHFESLRAKEKRRKPPTKAQKRNQMCTYMKNMAEVVKCIGKKAKSSGKEAVSKKRARKGLDEESVKRQKLEDDAEKEELRACLEIVQHDDSVLNIESLAIKYLIVDWKTHILSKDMFYYQIIRSDESTKYYKIFSAMLDDFDRQDMLDLYRLERIVGIKRLLSADEVTATSYEVTTADYGFYSWFVGKMVVAVSAGRRSVVGSSDKKLVWKLGNDEGIQFWKDKWADDFIMCERFPRLFRFEGDENVSVRNHGEWVVMGESGNGNGWVFLEGDQ